MVDAHEARCVDGAWRCTCGVEMTGEPSTQEERHARACGAQDMRRHVVRELKELLEGRPDYLEWTIEEGIADLIRDLENYRGH